jgi:phosphoribosylformylglycinamidine synthase
MAAKGEVGLDLDVRRVPLREAGMEPFEIMISESQERMLCVVEPDKVDEVLAVCARWEVNATAIGEVTDTRRAARARRRRAGRRHAGHGARRRVPGVRPRARRARDAALSGAAARARRRTRPRRCSRCSARRTSPRAAGRSSSTTAIVGSRTVRRPEQADAGACLMLDRRRARGAARASRCSIDGNGRRVAADPYRGAVEAVLECSANLACVGAEPLGLTELPELRQPGEAAHRLAAHARVGRARRRLPGARRAGRRRQRLALQRGREGPIYPTPVVGLVGELPDARAPGRLGFATRATRSR